MNRIAAAAVLALVSVLVLAACGSSNEAAPPPPAGPTADPHGLALPASTRVVLLSDTALPPSPGGQLLNVRLEAGNAPAGDVAATVVTDTDCTPDAAGVSHCRNELRLADGSTIVARHSHRMSEVPCLAPGEDVLVRPV